MYYFNKVRWFMFIFCAFTVLILFRTLIIKWVFFKIQYQKIHLINYTCIYNFWCEHVMKIMKTFLKRDWNRLSGGLNLKKVKFQHVKSFSRLHLIWSFYIAGFHLLRLGLKHNLEITFLLNPSFINLRFCVHHRTLTQEFTRAVVYPILARNLQSLITCA